MQNPINLALVIVVGLGMVGLIIWLVARATRNSWQNGQRLARALGLTHVPGKPALGWFFPAPRASGAMRGKRVEFFTYTTGHGKSRRHWAALSATPRTTSGLTFGLARQGLGTRVLALFGAKEIQVGDPMFDARWFIRTNQPDYFQTALLPEFRARIDAIDASFGLRGSFELKDGVVKYTEEGGFSSEQRIIRFTALADVLCDLADLAEVWAQEQSRA